MSQIQKTLVEYSGVALSAISNWISKAPAAFTAFLFAVLSSFMISMEYQNITLWIQRNMPRPVHRALLDLKEFIFSTLLQMLKAYAILFVITFLELTFGLWLLKIENFWSMALLIAVADALPVVGPGIVLVPWAITCCVSGNYFQGLGLLALFGIVALVRTIIEPKIIGKQFGLHPLATITAMYAGAQLWEYGDFYCTCGCSLFFTLESKSKIGIFLSKIYFNWQYILPYCLNNLYMEELLHEENPKKKGKQQNLPALSQLYRKNREQSSSSDYFICAVCFRCSDSFLNLCFFGCFCCR